MWNGPSPGEDQPSEGGAFRCIVADAADDAASLRAKLLAVTHRRVALVIPDHNPRLAVPLALRLLARAAARESIRLALVSRARPLRRLAHAEGLPTFSSLRSLSPPEDQLPSPLRASLHDLQDHVAGSLTWLAAITLVVSFALVVGLLVPRAVVYVQPISQSISGTVRVQADTQATHADPSRGLIPARDVYLEIHTSATARVPGPGRSTDGRAVGYITVENRTTEPVVVPAGSDFSTISGIHYQTTQPVTLPPRVGATATIPIIALFAGTASNAERGQVIVVGGRLRWLITAVNAEPIVGGGPPGEPFVTAWETKATVDQAMAEARRRAAAALEAQTLPGETVVPETVDIQPIEEVFDHLPGEAASRVTVHLTARAHAIIVSQSDLATVAALRWQPQIPGGYVPRAGSIRVGSSRIVSRTADHGIIFDVPLTATVEAALNTDVIASYVRLRPPGDAQRDLAHLPGLAKPARVEIIPHWMPVALRVQIIDSSSSRPAPAVAP
ncbi:MAG: baseplate J/gp47 family protein [Chloroflexi bacterium]|nr:baseplate J/gp47 family protein [Chloroflexota bacterium]